MAAGDRIVGRDAEHARAHERRGSHGAVVTTADVMADPGIDAPDLQIVRQREGRENLGRLTQDRQQPVRFTA